MPLRKKWVTFCTKKLYKNMVSTFQNEICIYIYMAAKGRKKTNLGIRCWHNSFTSPRNIVEPNRNEWPVITSPFLRFKRTHRPQVGVLSVFSFGQTIKATKRFFLATDRITITFISRCRNKRYTPIVLSQVNHSYDALQGT